MNTHFGFAERHIPTTLLIGAPLLLAGSAATVMFYGRRPNGRQAARRRVRDVMAENPACCRPDTPLREVAEQMVANDCGEIPICDEARRPIGVVTDRDIVCRLLAKGHDPVHATAKDCMSRPVMTCTPDMSLEDCAQLMERHQIRRAPVIDQSGAICGMIAQADLARKGSPSVAAKMVHHVSEPNLFASAVGGR